MPPASAKEFQHRTFRPRLPDAAEILPYLQEVDANRWYSNFGPLLGRFEERLADHFGIERDRLVTLANCTLALTLALESYEPAPGGLCALPSWTFIATALAVQRAGLTPWFIDVDEANWQLTPASVEAALAEAPGELAAVLPVAPFGAPLAAEEWQAFRERHGVPVVMDGAAAFDAATPAMAPLAVSLHATKPLAVGEGGLVLCESSPQAERLRRCSNFGFNRNHRVTMQGCNAKLSEYAAAVGLAALDAWPQRREAYARTAACYHDLLLAQSRGFQLAPGFAGETVTSSCNLLLDKPAAAAVIEDLRSTGVEARQWWQSGCHAQPVFADCPRTALPVTENLARRVIGIPYHPEMTEAEMAEVATAVNDAVARVGR